MKRNYVRTLTTTAILSVIAFLLMMLDFSLPMLIPGFVKMDISELPALFAAFNMGPLYGIAVCAVKNLLNLIFHGSTGGIGELCNFLLGAAFTLTAGLIYRYVKTRKGAVIASVFGAVVMALISIPVNYFISYPVYAVMFGGIDRIIGAYQALRPQTNGLLECLVVFNMPFTLIKGLIVSVICFFIYKPLSSILKKG